MSTLQVTFPKPVNFFQIHHISALYANNGCKEILVETIPEAYIQQKRNSKKTSLGFSVLNCKVSQSKKQVFNYQLTIRKAVYLYEAECLVSREYQS
jgi:hypothetical protein